MVAPIIFGLAFLAGLAGCNSRRVKEEEGCWTETADGRVPCSPVLVEGASEPVDSDGDRIPDEADQCPESPNIGSPDGCPPKSGVIDPDHPSSDCGADADRDGMKDCEDQCPLSFGIRQTEGCFESAYPVSIDSYRLAPLQSHSHVLGALKPCVHVAGFAETPILLWSSGRALHVYNGTERMLPVEPEGTADIDLCSLEKAITRDAQGNMTVLWNEGAAGDAAHLWLQRFTNAMEPLGEKQMLDVFPMPNLGPLADNRIATLGMKPGGDAVAVWVNRDKVLMRDYDATGILGSEVLVNDRDIHIEQSINPSVAVDEEGRVAVAWQIGSAPMGPLGLAVWEAGSRRLFYVGAVDELARHPAVAFAGGLLAVVWENSGILHLQSIRKENGSWHDLGSIIVAQPTPEVSHLLHPAILLDNRQRMVVAWEGFRHDTEPFKIFWKTYLNNPGQGEGDSVVLQDEDIPFAWSRLWSDPTGSAVHLLYPAGQQPFWNVESFLWEGNQAPLPGPGFFLENSNPVFTENVAMLNIENRGEQVLEIRGQLPRGFSIHRSGGTTESFEDSLPSLAGKIYLITAAGRGESGLLRLETNDPAHLQALVTLNSR
ncbi:MAG: thrombospondin type 3 repeat-containing protein [Deltaproteobacteria bacterium]|nr:thrombospondin type 3 repeat-containing protein [Deltaproteobacteria bacterium]